MAVGALKGVYPGKHFERMEKLRGLQGINRERMKLNIQNMQSLSSQVFTSVSSASEQKTVLIAEQARLRLENEQQEKSATSQSLNILV